MNFLIKIFSLFVFYKRLSWNSHGIILIRFQANISINLSEKISINHSTVIQVLNKLHKIITNHDYTIKSKHIRGKPIIFKHKESIKSHPKYSFHLNNFEYKKTKSAYKLVDVFYHFLACIALHMLWEIKTEPHKSCVRYKEPYFELKGMVHQICIENLNDADTWTP